MAFSPAIKKYNALNAWLHWHLEGRVRPHNNLLAREAEIDITTKCTGLPSCLKECTYRDSKKKGFLLIPTQADKVFQQLFEFNIRRLIFSGGGEPLDEPSLPSIIQHAYLKGFEIEILTNGKALTSSLFPSLLPYVAVLRISVPPFLNGYSHLNAIRDQIGAAVNFRTQLCLNTQITSSLLIRPDTPIEEIIEDISVLSTVNVDGIRFKPTHIWRPDGHLHLDISAYEKIIGFINGLEHPKVSIAKIDLLLKYHQPSGSLCYYADFNPFVIGADGQNYACCEQKYNRSFQREGLIQSSGEGTLFYNHQPVIKQSSCFDGCKGDLPNRLLHTLVRAHATFGEDIFADPTYQAIADAALKAIIRSNPQA